LKNQKKYIELTGLYPVDAEGLTKLADNPKVAQFLRDSFPQPYTLDHAKEFIRLMNEGNVQSVFAVRYKNEFAGIAGVHLLSDVQRRTVEAGFWFGEKFWGKGIATEVCRQLVKFAFTYYDIVKIQAEVAAPNHASAKVLRKNGFQLEGVLRQSFHKNGHDWDLHIYGLLREEVVDHF